MNRTKTVYLFIGTKEDAKLYPDPEPVNGKEYSEEEFEKIIDKFNTFPNEYLKHWKAVQKTEPIPLIEALSKMDRIEILKLYGPIINWSIEQVENYIAFGIKPD